MRKNCAWNRILVMKTQKPILIWLDRFPQTSLKLFFPIFCFVVSWIVLSLVESFHLAFLTIETAGLSYFSLERDEHYYLFYMTFKKDRTPGCLSKGHFVPLYSHFTFLYLFPPRDTLPSVVPTDPRQFCVPSQYGSSVLPNTNVPNMLPNPGYSGTSRRHCLLAAEPQWLGELR